MAYESTAWIYLVGMLTGIYFGCCLLEYVSKRSTRKLQLDYKGSPLKPVIRVNVKV